MYSFYLFPINFFFLIKSFAYLFYYKDISEEANIIHVHTLIGLVNYHGLYSFLKTYKKINEMQCPFKLESSVYIFFVPIKYIYTRKQFSKFWNHNSACRITITKKKCRFKHISTKILRCLWKTNTSLFFSKKHQQKHWLVGWRTSLMLLLDYRWRAYKTRLPVKLPTFQRMIDRWLLATHHFKCVFYAQYVFL